MMQPQLRASSKASASKNLVTLTSVCCLANASMFKIIAYSFQPFFFFFFQPTFLLTRVNEQLFITENSTGAQPPEINMMIGPVQSCSPYTLLDEEPAGPGPALGNVRFFFENQVLSIPSSSFGSECRFATNGARATSLSQVWQKLRGPTSGLGGGMTIPCLRTTSAPPPTPQPPLRL